MNLIPWYDECLVTKTEKFNFDSPQCDPVQLSKDMLQVMFDHKGVGLSANQIGIPLSVFVMAGYQENYACFNPRIVNYSVYEDGETLEEGCLSFPGLVFSVYRPLGVRIRFETPNGQTITKQFDGITGRCVQHEIDHLKGKLFFQNQSKLKIDMALKKAKKYGFNYDYSYLHKMIAKSIENE